MGSDAGASVSEWRRRCDELEAAAEGLRRDLTAAMEVAGESRAGLARARGREEAALGALQRVGEGLAAVAGRARAVCDECGRAGVGVSASRLLLEEVLRLRALLSGGGAGDGGSRVGRAAGVVEGEEGGIGVREGVGSSEAASLSPEQEAMLARTGELLREAHERQEEAVRKQAWLEEENERLRREVEG